MHKTSNYLIGLLTLLLFAAPTAWADKPGINDQVIEPYEAWFVMNMGGQKAGHMHVTLKQVGNEIVSTTQMKITIKRGATALEVEQASRFIETLDHKPLQANSSVKMSALETKQSLDFTGEKWKLTTINAGRTSVREIDAAGAAWLTPGGLSAVLKQAIENGDQAITVTTLDLSTGIDPITMTMKRGESADIEVFGRVVPATQWSMTMSAAPGIAIEQWTDDAGQPVRQLVPLMPGMEMEMLLADKALALAEFDAPEMLASSLIKPDKPIKNPRKLKRAVFDLIAKDLKKNIGNSVPNDGYQTTQWVDENTLRVTVDLDKAVAIKSPLLPNPDNAPQPGGPGFGGLPAPLLPHKEYRQTSSMLNYKDEAIRSLLTQLRKDQPFMNGQPHADEAYYAWLPKVGYATRDFVRDHIDAKDLSVGFASASETARTKQGDCTEHACLLAAMLRGAGIPSRTVTGLVYADQFVGHEGVFGFHMWTQAWIATEDGKGYWLDLDAALPGDINGFDATHIALSTSAMKDGDSLNDMVTMLPLMQGLKVKIVETQWAD